MTTEQFIEKAKKVIKDKYGVSNISQVPEIQMKKIKNATKKYVYYNVAFDSACEMSYYYFLKKNNIKFEFHPDEFFEYNFKGKKVV